MQELIREFCQLWEIQQLILYFHRLEYAKRILAYGLSLNDDQRLKLENYFCQNPSKENNFRALANDDNLFKILNLNKGLHKFFVGYFAKEQFPAFSFFLRFQSEEIPQKPPHNSFRERFCFSLNLLAEKIDTAYLAKQRSLYYEILESFGAVVSSTLDLEELYWLIYNHIRKVMDADSFLISLLMPDGKSFELAFMIDEEVRYPRVIEPIGKGIISQALQCRKPAVWNRTPEEIAAIKTQKNCVNLFGNRSRISRSILTCPLINHDRIIGVISAQSYRYNAYNANHIRLMKTLASQIGVAIENARLFNEQQKKAKIFALADEINQIALKTKSAEQVIKSFLFKLKYYFESKAYAFFYAEQDSKNWRAWSSSEVGWQNHGVVRRNELCRKSRFLKIVLNQKQSVAAGDVDENEWLSTFFDFAPKSLLIIPMIIEMDIDGILLVAETGHMAFSKDDAKWFEILLSRLSITFQKIRFLQSISAERDRLVAILNHLREGVHILDKNFNIVFANRWAKENLIPQHHGNKCFEVFFGLSKPCEKCPIGRGIALQDKASFETTGSDGRIYEISLLNFTNTDGKGATLEIVKDVTREKYYNEEKIKVEKLKTVMALAGTIAHELNQPLTGITGLASLILEDLDWNEFSYESIKEIEIQADRMRDLIRKFQNITKIEKMDYEGKDIVDLRRSIE